ncbi:hypothetical protein MHI39_13910 [Heyndrickxia sp. FSL K6-6286]|uniref:SGNH/GDSL hydrolase family protein n=1 Tax=Heyndrickxia TaxID=2837504 RepID=UPI0003A059EB|nr:hypothetical protein [Heyndrickxia oleronia]MBU5210844.1 hypothetical protein [Heyndrickxia oleronia]
MHIKFKTLLWGILIILFVGLVVFFTQERQEDTTNFDKPVLKKVLDDRTLKVKEHNSSSTEEVQKENQSTVHPKPINGKSITAIGDSVLLGVSPYLEKMIPGIVVDGKVGRQMIDAQEVIDQLKSQGKLGEQIIIELGTNGLFNQDKLRSLLDSIKNSKHIYLVNTRVPREWQDKVNENLAEVAKDYKNTTVIDWYSSSKEVENYFYEDGVHLKPKGAEYYATLIMNAVQEEIEK